MQPYSGRRNRETGPSSGQSHGMPRKGPLDESIGIERHHTQIAQYHNRRTGIREQSDHTIGEPHHFGVIGAASMCIALEQRRPAQAYARIAAIDYQLGQRRHIAQPKVEALSGHRVELIGGIADNRAMRSHDSVGGHSHNTVHDPLIAGQESAEALAELTPKGSQKGLVIECFDRVHLIRGESPDQTTTALGQRQQSEGATPGKALEGRLSMIQFRHHRSGQRHLPVVVMPASHTECFEDLRLAAFSDHQQLGLQLSLRLGCRPGAGQLQSIRTRFDGLDADARQDVDRSQFR